MISWNNIGQPLTLLVPFNLPNSVNNFPWLIRARFDNDNGDD